MFKFTTSTDSSNSMDVPLSAGRRNILGFAGTGLGLYLSGAGISLAAQDREAVKVGPVVRIPRSRLDALARTFYPAFNHGGAVPPYESKLHDAKYDVELRTLTTTALIPETGDRVEVTGLLALPVGATGSVPVVSWQHGTILSFDQVPSNLMRLGDPQYKPSDAGDSLETILNLHRLTGQGFALIGADYLGKGALRGTRGEAYGVRDATVATCTSILDVGLEQIKRLGLTPSGLFLNGWSQGGANTQWLHQALRRKGVVIRASAAQSPFNNLLDTLRFWTGVLPVADSSAYPKVPGWASLCLIILLGSYREYYGLPELFQTAIKPRYLNFAENYWRTYRLEQADLVQAPASMTDLLVDGFTERFTADTNAKFLVKAGENASTFYTYDAPFRFYYGLADEALHPSLMSVALTVAGSKADSVAVPAASHRETFLASLYGHGRSVNGLSNVPDWFRSFL